MEIYVGAAFSAPGKSDEVCKEVDPVPDEKYLGIPDRRCSPSMFCVMTIWTRPTSTRRASAMCVRVGCASSHDTFMSGLRLRFSRVQTPLGPRKSGMPAEVLMPAPVCTTQHGAAIRQRIADITL
jgi:hypothetical protein